MRIVMRLMSGGAVRAWRGRGVAPRPASHFFVRRHYCRRRRCPTNTNYSRSPPAANENNNEDTRARRIIS